MADDVRAFEAAHNESAPRLLVISTGTAEATRAEGFRSPTALDSAGEAANALDARGTPMAVRINPDGQIASAVAQGADQVLELIMTGSGATSTRSKLTNVTSGPASRGLGVPAARPRWGLCQEAELFVRALHAKGRANAEGRSQPSSAAGPGPRQFRGPATQARHRRAAGPPTRALRGARRPGRDVRRGLKAGLAGAERVASGVARRQASGAVAASRF
jgi:hypothetical protein